MKKFLTLTFTIALIVSLIFFLRIEPLYVLDSYTKNSSFVDFLVKIFEDIDTLPSNQCRYNAKDDQGAGLDTIKIIANPQGGYLGVYHFPIGESLEYSQVRLACSADLLNWTFVRTVELQASQPTIAQAPNGAYIVAFEKHVFIEAKEERHIGFHYYPNVTCLLTGSEFCEQIANLTIGAQLEGTPNINNITIVNSIMNASIGFHYNDAYGLDNVATGHLTVPLDNPKDTMRWNWTTAPLSEYNEKLRREGDVKGNIGDRDYGQVFGRKFTLQEGNLYENSPQTNWTAWRIFLYDHSTSNFTMLNIKTHEGSISFGNPTFTFLKSPNGKDCVVITYFLFSEGAEGEEAGELIFYKEFETKQFSLVYKGKSYFANVTSNSTILHFNFNETERSINFNVSGPDGSKGYCVVKIPNDIMPELWQSNYTVLLDGESLQFENWKDIEDTYIYFTYQYPAHQVIIIIPEFPSFPILPILMIATLLAFLVYKRHAIVIDKE